MQRQTAVTATLKSEQLLLFAVVQQVGFTAGVTVTSFAADAETFDVYAFFLDVFTTFAYDFIADTVVTRVFVWLLMFSGVYFCWGGFDLDLPFTLVLFCFYFAVAVCSSEVPVFL